jgi:hypothetical protein
MNKIAGGKDPSSGSGDPITGGLDRVQRMRAELRNFAGVAKLSSGERVLLYALVSRCLDRLETGAEPAVWGTYEAIFDYWMDLREKIAQGSAGNDLRAFHRRHTRRFAKQIKAPESIGPYASNWIRETSRTLKTRAPVRIDIHTDARRVYLRVLSDATARGNGEQLLENPERAKQRRAMAKFEEAANPVISLVRDEVKPLNTIIIRNAASETTD